MSITLHQAQGLHEGAASRPTAAARSVGPGPGAHADTSSRHCISGVTFLDQRELIPMGSNEERGTTFLVRELMAATTASQREAIVRTRLDEMGFEWMGYYTTARLAGGGASRSFVQTYAPDDWSRLYFQERYHEVDPRLLRPQRSSLPMVWDLASMDDMVDQAPACNRTRRFLKDLHQSCIGSGVFERIVTTTPHMVEETVVSLVSNEPSRRWIDDRVLGDAIAFGRGLHDHLSRHMRMGAAVAPAAPAPAAAADGAADTVHTAGLSAMQQAVLRHVADGLTDREMAEQLRMSLHTVDYHLRQLRRRYAVHNRVQLVAAVSRQMAAA